MTSCDRMLVVTSGFLVFLTVGFKPDVQATFTAKFTTTKSSPDNIAELARTAPGPVSNFRHELLTSYSFIVKWESPQLPPDAIVEYALRLESAGRPYPWRYVSGASRSMNFTNLQPETAYTANIMVVDRSIDGFSLQGKLSQIDIITECNQSSTVTDIKADLKKVDSFRVYWYTPSKMCGVLSNYEVQLLWKGLSPRLTSFSYISFTSLLPYTSYTVMVTALSNDVLQHSLRGLSTIITVYTDSAASGPVSNLQRYLVTSDSISVKWEPPRNPNGVIEQYSLVLESSNNELMSFTVSNVSRSAEFKNLQPETSYMVQIAPISTSNNGSTLKGEVARIAVITICKWPSSVRDLKADSITKESFRIYWSEPMTKCGAYATYDVERLSASPADMRTSSVTERQLHIQKLKSYTNYVITVTTISTDLLGRFFRGPSSTLTVQTDSSESGPVSNLQVGQVTSYSFKLTWLEPGLPNGLIEKYQLWLSSTRKLYEVSNKSLSQTFFGLEPETHYAAHIRAISKSSSGLWLTGEESQIILSTACVVSTVVMDLKVLSVESYAFTVIWSEPFKTCGHSSTYEVLLHQSSSVDVFSVADMNITLSSLLPCTEYNITVTTLGTDILGVVFRGLSVTTIAKTASTEPSSVHYTFTQDSGVHVKWSSPEQWNGCPDGYYVLLNDSSSTQTVKKMINETSHIFTGLPTSTYNIYVIASNTQFNGSIDVAHTKFEYISSNDGTVPGTVMILLSVGAICLVLAASALMFFMYRRHRKRRQPLGGALSGVDQSLPLKPLKATVKSPERSKSAPNYVKLGSGSAAEKKTLLVPPVAQDLNGSTMAIYDNAPSLTAVAIQDLPSLVHNEQQKDAPFAEEYAKLTSVATSLLTVGQRPENKKQNRFKDILPYDHNRVVLQTTLEDSTTDYINASYIEGYNGQSQRYIAAQGPSPDTVEDFWRMVWQIRSEVIVMVTRLFEAGKVKCEKYWPESGSQRYGRIDVTLVSSETFPDYQINVLKVLEKDSAKAGGKELLVKHFYFTGWPDHDVPAYALSLLLFRRNVKNFVGSTDAPAIVHCSAGVGRTGTYLAIDYLLDEAGEQGRIDVLHCVSLLRRQRMKMVQTREQYGFVYQALKEATQAGDTCIPCERFFAEYSRLKKTSGASSKTSLLSAQYEVFLKAVGAMRSEVCSVALLPENAGKNRDSSIIPANDRRPILITPGSAQGSSDYINAVFLDGYKSKCEFIVTQLPLAHTVEDFWRMVHDHNVRAIILLSDGARMDTTTCWPKVGEDWHLGNILNIKCTDSNTVNDTLTTRDFKVANSKAGTLATVRQFEYHDWPASNVRPNSVDPFLSLINAVDKFRAQSESGVVTVQCRDGAQRCGLFVAATNMLQRLNTEQHIDVYLSSLLLRQHRPQLLNQLEQFSFLYDLAATYMDTFETYSNFLPHVV